MTISLANLIPTIIESVWLSAAPRCEQSFAMDEASLMKRVGGGDQQAFAILVREHEHWARTFATRILRDADEAEDIAQEVFLKLWVNAPKWQPRGSLRGYLATMLSRQCIDFLRKKRPGMLRDDYDPPDLSPSIRLRLERESEDRRMALLIEQLPPRQRLSIALFYDEELSLREAGEAMELTEKGFESLLQRARTQLRKLWKEQP
ncbi:sigma-70 family RNA polymerase sigma factor [bacterium]|nr:sigma-70 family RNA polymerase sigma factor [bacterium]